VSTTTSMDPAGLELPPNATAALYARSRRCRTGALARRRYLGDPKKMANRKKHEHKNAGSCN
jgi:hypothetical protein